MKCVLIPSEIFLFLFFISSDDDWHGAKSVGLDSCQNAGAAVSDLLGHDAAVQSSKPESSVLSRDVSVHQAELVSLLDDGPWELASLIVVGSVGNDLLSGEFLCQINQLLLLLTYVEVHP